MVTRVKNTPIGVVYEDGEVVGAKVSKSSTGLVVVQQNESGQISDFLMNGTNIGGVIVLSTSGRPSDTIVGSTDPQRLASWTIPAGLMGPNDTLVLMAKATNTNSATVKYLYLYMNEELVGEMQNTTNTNMSVLWTVSARNSSNTVIGTRLNSSGVGATTLNPPVRTVDLNQNVEVSVRGWILTDVTQSITLESHLLFLVKGVDNRV